MLYTCIMKKEAHFFKLETLCSDLYCLDFKIPSTLVKDPYKLNSLLLEHGAWPIKYFIVNFFATFIVIIIIQKSTISDFYL